MREKPLAFPRAAIAPSVLVGDDFRTPRGSYGGRFEHTLIGDNNVA